jgi:hypothetical protein
MGLSFLEEINDGNVFGKVDWDPFSFFLIQLIFVF